MTLLPQAIANALLSQSSKDVPIAIATYSLLYAIMPNCFDYLVA